MLPGASGELAIGDDDAANGSTMHLLVYLECFEGVTTLSYTC